MHEDGNLSLWSPGSDKPKWTSKTQGNRVAWAVLQEDGNFVIYKTDGTPVWATNTSGQRVAWVVVQDDGNVVLYHPSGRVLWATGTNTPDRKRWHATERFRCTHGDWEDAHGIGLSEQEAIHDLRQYEARACMIQSDSVRERDDLHTYSE